MTRGLFKQGLNAVLLVIVAAFLLLALYSAVGQQVLPRIGEYKDDIVTSLADVIGSEVGITKLWGDMEVLTPSVHVENFTLHSPDQDSPLLSVAAVDAVLNPYESLLNLTPVFKRVRLSGVTLDLRHLESSQAGADTDANEKATGSGLESVIVGLLLQHSVEVNGVTIFTRVNGKERTLNVEQLALKGDGFHRLINGNLVYAEDEKPIKTSFRIYSEGHPYDLDTFYARGSVDLPQVDVAFWLGELLNGNTVEELDGSAHLSFEFDKGLLQGAKFSLAAPTVKVANQPVLERLTGDVWVKQSSADNWTLWLEKSQFHLNRQPWNLSDIGAKLSKQIDGNRWQVYAKELDLQPTHELLNLLGVLPKKLADRLNDMAPKGVLEHATFVLNTKARADSEFTFASQLSHVSIKAAEGIPGVENLSGVIAANKQLGRVQFDGADLRLDIPRVYEKPLDIVQGKGQVEWFIEDQQIRLVGDGLQLQLNDVEEIAGGFQVWLGQESEQHSASRDNQILLNLGIRNAQASAQKSLVPTFLSDSLKDWLDSGIKSGQIPDGQLLLFTSIADNAPSPVVELFLDVKDAQLNYLADWPQVNKLSGKLLLDGSRLRVAEAEGQSLGGNIYDGVVLFDDDEEGLAALWVALKAKGRAQEGLDYFTQTPLQKVVNHALDGWTITRNQDYAMALKVPMEAEHESLSIDLTSRLKQSDLHLTSLDLIFNDIAGVIGYSSKRGLYSQKLQAGLWQEPATLNIQTDFVDGSMVTTFDIQGGLSTAGLKQWTKMGLLEGLSGAAPVTGQFVLDTRENGVTGLLLHSMLNGIQVNLPEPFGLTKEQEKQLTFELELSDPTIIKLAYGHDMNLAMSLNGDGLASGQVYLGTTEAYIPADPGLVIQGHIEEIRTEQWMPVWERIQAQTLKYDQAKSEAVREKDAQTPSPLRQVLLSTDAVIHEGNQYDNIQLDIRHDAGDWRFDINAPVAKGSVLMPRNDVLDIDLAYVHLPASRSDKTERPDESHGQSPKKVVDPLVDIDPKGFPAMSVRVGEVFVGAINYGQWDLTIQPDEAGALFIINEGHIKKLDVQGDIYWYRKANHYTQAKLNLSTKDVGGIQKAWRMKPAIEAKKGKADVILDWQGSPAAFNVATLSGDANFKLQNGSFVDAKDAEALNAFGILNFASVGRRLRLDFSDLYTEGLAFDRFEAKTQLDDGVLTIIDTMDVEGPAAKFATSGSINLNTKELDQQLSVTFPVSSTLPLVAILAGFAPPVAASIFVGERLVGDEIERFTSATYQISGPWDDPKLELKKRFDNKIEGKKKRTFWHRMKDVFGLGKD